MKLLLKLFATIFITIVAGAAAIYFLVFSEGERDQVNPFIKEESRYFIVTEDGTPYGPKNMERYSYDVVAYNEQLHSEMLHVTSATNLRHNAVIEVVAKGKHVEAWREVKLHDLSDDLQNKLQKE